MAEIYLQKISGVLSITQTTGYGKYYAATQVSGAKFNPTSDGTGVYIFIGTDSYTISLSDLRVNGQAPTTLSTALVLLNSIFGT